MSCLKKIILAAIALAYYTEVCCGAIPNAWYDKLSLVVGSQQEVSPVQQTPQPIIPSVQHGVYHQYNQPQSQLLQFYQAAPVYEQQSYRLLPSPASRYSYPAENQCRLGQSSSSIFSSPASHSLYYPKPINSRWISS